MRNQNYNHNHFRVFKDINELGMEAALDFAKRAKKAVQENGVFRVALSGGNTPKYLFKSLANKKEFPDIPWENVHVFWGDERYVSHSSEESNYNVASALLFAKVGVKKKNIHPMPTDFEDPKDAAKSYQKLLAKEFKSKSKPPVFDLVYLGMGSDGHTASLFPKTEIVKKLINNKVPNEKWVAAFWVEKANMFRVTLLPSVLNASKRVVFLVSGDDKAAVLNSVITGKVQPLLYPVQFIHSEKGEVVWFADRAATSVLDNI